MISTEQRIIVYNKVIDSLIEEVYLSIMQRESLYKSIGNVYGFTMCKRLTHFGNCSLSDLHEFVAIRDYYGYRGVWFDIEDFDSRFDVLDRMIKLAK